MMDCLRSCRVTGGSSPTLISLGKLTWAWIGPCAATGVLVGTSCAAANIGGGGGGGGTVRGGSGRLGAAVTCVGREGGGALRTVSRRGSGLLGWALACMRRLTRTRRSGS